jgi:hypothetical protein
VSSVRCPDIEFEFDFFGPQCGVVRV